MSTPAAVNNPAWINFLRLFVAYVLGVWTFLQFLEWILNRTDTSPHWVDLILWINLGLLPSLLLYFRHHQRMNDFRFKRWEKFFIGLNLLVLLVILIYSFRGKDMGSTTKKVTYFGEDGREEIRKITKSEFRTLCGTYNFEPANGNTPDSTTWLGDGIRELLTLDLKQDKALTVVEFTEAATTATKVENSKLGEYYIDGIYHFSEDGYTITPRVHNSNNDKVITEQTFRGKDLFALIDSMSVFVRTAVGVGQDEQLYSPDLPLREYTTDSLRALRYFCRSTRAGMERALAVDSGFILAHAYLGRWRLKSGNNAYERDKHLKLALEGRHKLPSDLAQEVLTNWHLANGDLEAAKASLKLQLQVEPDNQAFNQQMIDVLVLSRQFEELLVFTEDYQDKYFSPFAAMRFGDALMVNHKFDELLRRIRPISLVLPKDATVLDYTFRAQLFAKRWPEAAATLQKIKALFPEYKTQISFYTQVLRNHRSANGNIPGWEDHLGKRQILGTERVNDYHRNPHGGLTFNNSNGQVVLPMLLSRDSFLLGSFQYLDVCQVSFNAGKLATGRFHSLRAPNLTLDDVRAYYAIAWPEKLQAAEADLKSGRYAQAKEKYLALREEYPTHNFFLQNALDHIDYVTRIGPEAYQAKINVMAGYTKPTGGTDLWVDKERLYIKTRATEEKDFETLDLLPISADTYVSLTNKSIKYTVAAGETELTLISIGIYSMDTQEWNMTYNPKYSPERVEASAE